MRSELGRAVRRVRRARRRVKGLVGPPARNAALSLLYHRVAHDEVDPWRLAVTPEHLEEHLDILAAHTHPLTAAELHAARQQGRVGPRSVVVTFDDGYADLATEIAPRLRRAGVPATMYIVSRAVDRNREFWWDALERALLEPHAAEGELALTIGGQQRSWHVGDASSRTTVHREVWHALRGRGPDERDDLVEQILAWAGLSVEPRATHRTLQSAELHALASDGLVQIGAHTASHPWLAGLTPQLQKWEIEQGRADLEEMISAPVTTFAYPHGGPQDVGPVAVEHVRRAGFDTGFLATAGRLGARGNPHRLPRLFVENTDGEGLARLLWLYAGIKVS